jgi:hypothetical protein
MPETMAMSPKVTIGTSTEMGKVTTKVAAAKVSTAAATPMSKRIRGNRQAAKRQK